ncbi:trypsin-like serine peptidase [Nonomuraea sp. LPB2021202275-12-8]|uniref:trypsin-like serine peptidase n=1 Tax=Nonomuraea sp. LPB2021202275-12-8 TaxID=3120159 RepID=UPI00300C6CD9
MFRLVLALALLDPAAVTEVSHRNIPLHKVLTPDGDRLGYAPVSRPFTGARRLTGVLVGRDPATGTHLMCGGAVLSSRSRSLVLTAAHCLYHQGRMLRRLAFLPAYDRGSPPLGVWPVVRTWVPARWRGRPYSADLLPYDVGLVGVATAEQRPLEDVTGRGLRPLATGKGTSLRGLELLGYPKGKRYPGTRMYRCLGDAVEGAENGPGVLVTRNCHAAAGGSGGPAVYGGAVAGVVSSSSPLSDTNGFTVLTRLGGKLFARMYEEADRSMRLRREAGSP